MKIALLMTAIILGLGVILELLMRYLLGFGNPLLYKADETIGYLLAPNQQTRRFGRQIQINQYSMRSPAIAPERPEQTLRVLLLGDSIANGGWWTDQSKTISSLMADALKASVVPSQFQTVEVLNASANSWGPRNELAYLHRFGSFGAQVIVLLLNTDDLFAITPTPVQVGRDRNYPDQKPGLAWIELYQRYLTPATPIPELDALHAEGGDRVGANLTAIQHIQDYAQQGNSHLIIAMTPLKREVGDPGPRDYERKARQRLQELSQLRQIPYLDFLPSFNREPNPASLYYDHIHLSAKGNQQVSQTLAKQVRQMLD
jgi:lysophospholipase L1-like esterase